VASASLVGACSFGRSGDHAAGADRVAVGSQADADVGPSTSVTDGRNAVALSTSTSAHTENATPAGDRGAIDVAIASPAGRPAPGIPVRLTGPTNSVTTSTADDGHLRATLAPGRYTLEVSPACSDAVQVLTSGRAAVAVAAGQTSTGSLRVEWRHRFGPGGKTTYKAVDGGEDRGRRWQIGRKFEVRFLLIDRCQGDAPAAGRAIGTFQLDGGSLIQVDRAPTTAAADGALAALVHCTQAADELELDVRDAAQPEDTRDLFDRSALDDSPPSCEP
jgi:hypothetical protein